MLGEARRRGPTPRWWPLRGHPEQQRAILAALAYGIRFLFLDSGRRSGKTDLAKRFLIYKIADTHPEANPRPWPDPRFFYGMPTRDQAKRVAWRDLLKLIPDDWIAGGKFGPNVSYGELWVRTWWGAELWVLGMDNPARFEGNPWDGGVLDEMCDQQEGCFDLHVRPGLDTVEDGVNRRGWCWMIGKPSRKGPGARWFRERCEMCRKGEYEGGAAFTWSSESVLPEETIRQLKQTLSAKDFAEQVRASWQNAGGGIYHAFSPEEGCCNVQPCERRDNLPICVGSDFNIDPMCWVLAHRIGDRLEVFDELIIRDCNTPRALNELWNRYGHHPGGWQFYGDASGRARKTSATQSDYAHIWNDERFKKSRGGRTLHYPGDNPGLEDRFSATNARLCNAEGLRRLFIDRKCRRLIEDLETRSYKAGTREPADGKDQGHASDALDYIVHRIWPIRFNVAGEGKQSVIVGERREQQSIGPTMGGGLG
jgi:hypothetical protein